MREFTDVARANLRKAKRALTLGELIQKMKKDGATPFEVRGALLRLMDNQEAALTRFGKIKAKKTNIRLRQRLRKREGY